jgi:roadblock/LC7 domain-containing protein
MATLSKLKELMSIPGAVAAGEFANKLMGNMQAKGWSAYTGQGGFYPVRGFAVAGGKYAACIMGNVGVFVELSKADFDKTFEVLSKYI